MKLKYFLTLCTKINSKWIKDLNVRLDITKLLEENIGRTPFDINHSKIIFNPPPIVMKIKTITKWDLIKFKSFCTAKETTKTKRQLTKQEKIFANNTTDKGLISKIYKQPMKLNIKTSNNLNKNGQERNISLKKTYKWPKRTWKDIQHC